MYKLMKQETHETDGDANKSHNNPSIPVQPVTAAGNPS